MKDLSELEHKVAGHLAGKPITIKWRNPPASNAVGQVVKTPGGEMVIFIGNLTSVNARFAVLLHEIAHARKDAEFIPVSNDHKLAPGSIKPAEEARQAWRQNPRELRANDLGDQWVRYAEKNAYKYWRVGRSEMECKLLSLLDWRG